MDKHRLFKSILEGLTSIEQEYARQQKASNNANAQPNIFSIVGKALSPLINDNDDEPMPPTTPATVAPISSQNKRQKASYAIRGGQQKVSDEQLVSTLTREWQSPPPIKLKLAAMDIHVSRGTVYRLKDIAKQRDDVEQSDYPLAWRIKADVKRSGDGQPKPSGQTVGAAVAKASPRRKTVAANDDITVSSPKLVNGDGLAMLRSMPDKSVDMVLADLPYGITGNKIDPKVDLKAWMYELQRVVTPRGSIVSFGACQFTTDLCIAGRVYDKKKGSERFEKSRLVWEKNKATGFQFAETSHLRAHEDIIIFSHGALPSNSPRAIIYNPQDTAVIVRKNRAKQRSVHFVEGMVIGSRVGEDYNSRTNCPRSVLYYPKDSELHPYAKPIALLEYLIRTFSNDNALVVDPTMGSGSTGVAAFNTGRRFIGAENGYDKNTGESYFNIAEKRIREAMSG